MICGGSKRCGGSNEMSRHFEMWWVNGRAQDFWGRGPGFDSGISLNGPGALQVHFVIHTVKISG